MLRSYFARHGRRSRASVLPPSWTPKGANGSRRSRPSSHQAACAHVLSGRSMEAGTDGSCLFSPWACHAKALKPAPRARPSVLASVRLTTQHADAEALVDGLCGGLGVDGPQQQFERTLARRARRRRVRPRRVMRAQNRAAFTSPTDPSPALHEGILNYFKFSRECQRGSSRPSSESIHRLGLGGYGWMDGSIDLTGCRLLHGSIALGGVVIELWVGATTPPTHRTNGFSLHFTSSDKR